MDNQINVGDVVQLKSGGVNMTISEIIGRSATCQWQYLGKKESEIYDIAMLKKVDPDKRKIRIRSI